MQSRSIFKRFIKIGDTVRSIQRFQRATISRLNFGLAVCSFGGQFYLRVLPRRQWRVRSISVRPCRKNEIGKLDGSQPTTARGRKERGKGRTGDRVWLAGKQRLASFYQRIPDESREGGGWYEGTETRYPDADFSISSWMDTGRTFEPDRSGALAGKDGGVADRVMRWADGRARGGEGWKYGGRCWRRPGQGRDS